MMEVTSTTANFFVIFCVVRPVLFLDRQRRDLVRGGTMPAHRQKNRPQAGQQQRVFVTRDASGCPGTISIISQVAIP